MYGEVHVPPYLEMERKEDELTECILEAKTYPELPNRLRSQVTDEEYRNRVLLFCFERQLRFGKIVKLAIKDEQRYYQLLERESREKMRIFPYHIQVTLDKNAIILKKNILKSPNYKFQFPFSIFEILSVILIA